EGALVRGLHERGHRQVELALGKEQLGLSPRSVLELQRRRGDASNQVLRSLSHRERLEPGDDLVRDRGGEAVFVEQVLVTRDGCGLGTAGSAAGDHEREQDGTDHERSPGQPHGTTTGPTPGGGARASKVRRGGHHAGSISLSTTHLWFVIIIPSAS